jgi:predicted negative regulator of RcsB-dependent stress response
VKSATRHALKQDALAKAAASSASWVSGHRAGVVRWAIVIGVVLLLVAGAVTFWVMQSTAADVLLGEALDTYDAPLTQPGEPPMTGMYATAAERTKKAHEQFAAVADKYGYLPEGTKAKYFVAVTDQEMGQTAAAETGLKSVADSMNHDLANLARMALANIYHQTKRDSDAIKLLDQIVAKPSSTVTAAAAQLELADIYDAEGQKDQAKALWTKLKTDDKDGAAGAAATKKLK